MFAADRLDHVAFTARDLEALARWYETVFGMRRVHADAWPDLDGGHPLVLCAGTVCVALFRAREGVAPRPADPADPNEHFALALDRANFEQARIDLDSALPTTSGTTGSATRCTSKTPRATGSS